MSPPWKRRHLLALGAMAVATSGVRPVRAEPDSPVRYFDAEFRARMADSESLWSQKRAPLSGLAGPIDTCEAFVVQAPYLEEDRRSLDYQICLAINAVRHARAPVRPSECYEEPSSCEVASMLAHRLDFATFPNSLGPQIGRAHV